MLAFVKEIFARSFLVIIAVSMASAIVVLLISGDQRMAQRTVPVMGILLLGLEFYFFRASADTTLQTILAFGVRFAIIAFAAVALTAAYQS